MSSRADATRDRIAESLTDPLRALGLDVEAVEITPAGKRRVLRVAVDADGGVTLDHVADATREVSRVLDESDVMGEMAYTLEVTSRGVDRPLTLPRHWRRNRSRLVRVTLVDETTCTGRVGDSDDDTVSLDVDGQSVVLPYDAIERALVQIEFNRPKSTLDPEADDADDEIDVPDDEQDDQDETDDGEEED